MNHKCRENLKELHFDFVLEFSRYKLTDKMFTSKTICSSEHDLFISVVNFSDEEVALNKNIVMAKLNFCNKQVENLKFYDNVINDRADTNFDHADLDWDYSINQIIQMPQIKLQKNNFQKKTRMFCCLRA